MIAFEFTILQNTTVLFRLSPNEFDPTRIRSAFEGCDHVTYVILVLSVVLPQMPQNTLTNSINQNTNCLGIAQFLTVEVLDPNNKLPTGILPYL